VSVQPHPRSPHLLLVCCAGALAALLDTRSGALTSLPCGAPSADAAAAPAPAGRKGASAPAPAAPAAATSSVALFSRGGPDALVFVGSNVGTLAAVAVSAAAAPAVRECVRLGSAAGGAGAGVRSLCLSRRGGVLLATCADRVLRALHVSHATPAAPQLRPLREFRDAVNKTAWRAGALSADGAYVAAAASGSSSEHVLHVWCRDSGALQCVLEGPPDAGAPASLAWHPSAPLLASLGGKGRVYVWARAAAENWSAFAPDFRELEENEEYVEREDEFDAPAAAGGAQAHGEAQGEAQGQGAAAAAHAGGDDATAPLVDVLTLDAATSLGGDSDSDDAGALHHLPLVLEPDAAPLAAEAPAHAAAGEPDGAPPAAADVHDRDAGDAAGGEEEEEEDGAQHASKKARA
jgi:COMPASS component SWD1